MLLIIIGHNYMKNTKDAIIAEYNKLKEYLGKPPSSRTFERDRYSIKKIFGRNLWKKFYGNKK